MSLKMSLNLTLPDVDNPVQTGDTTHRRNCRQLSKMFDKIATGNIGGSQQGVQTAYGTVTLSSTSGALVVTINGTSVTQTHDTNDDTDGLALAALINANATLKKLVKARYSTATNILTIEALLPGPAGNYTLTVSGTGLTASGATLTLGADVGSLDLRTSAENAWNFLTASHTVTGTLTATIGGTAVAITAPLGVGDTVAGRAAANQSLRQLANAINANTTVNKWVRAYTEPNAYVTLTDTTADTLTVTVNNVACTVTASTTEDDVGALLVAAVNALTSSHGCVARYVDATNILYIHPIGEDKRVKLAVSGAGMGTSAVGGNASTTLSIDAVTAAAINVIIGSTTCSITATDTDEDTQGALLVTAINAKTAEHGCVASYASGGGGGAAGTLTLKSQWPGSAQNEVNVSIGGAGAGNSTPVAATLARLDGGFDRCVIECLAPGVLGNAVAVSVSGTGLSVVGAQLSGGSESRVTYSL